MLLALTAHHGQHAAAHGGDPLTLLLIAAAVLAGWGISLLARPWKPCPSCAGTGRHQGGIRRRFGRCHACAGTGQCRRIGATAVHRLYWDLFGDHLREHHRHRIDHTQQPADHPDPTDR